METIIKELPVAVTVCDKNGKILKMNDKSQSTFKKSGGEELIGADVLACHPEPAQSKLREMLQEPTTNAYTIEKNGVKKLIYQTPWFQGGVYQGFVELSMEIPMDMPHYVRAEKNN